MNAFNTMKKCGFGDYIYHIVTFNLDGGIRTGGGELLQRLLSGKDATPPVFTKTLYSFREWDSPVTDIVTSKTIKALYDVNVNVQFVAIGSNSIIISADGVNWLVSLADIGALFGDNGSGATGAICWNGSMFVAGGSTGAPSGQASIIYSYNGVNWFASPSADALMPNMCSSVCSKNAPNLYPPTNSDVMTNISYNITFNTGVGTWNDDTADNIILSVSEGYLPVYPTTIKAPTGYYATGWSPSLAVATENKTYTAQFAEIIPLNTVYFDLAGGTRTGGGALSQSVADNGYATEPTCSPPISHHPDHRNFTWIGWDTALGPITGNTTITALWQMNEF